MYILVRPSTFNRAITREGFEMGNDSPYPAPGSGEHTKPQGGEPDRRSTGDMSGKDPNVPAPQKGGPERPGGAPAPSTGVGGKK